MHPPTSPPPPSPLPPVPNLTDRGGAADEGIREEGAWQGHERVHGATFAQGDVVRVEGTAATNARGACGHAERAGRSGVQE